MPREEILSFEEIERFVRVAVTLGVTQDSGHRRRAAGAQGSAGADRASWWPSPAFATSRSPPTACCCASMRRPLYDAGLRRLNVHLDTLDRERFLKITRRDDLPQGSARASSVAQRIGFGPIKINAVAVKNLVEPDIVPLARYGRERDIEIRYIEFMPLDSQGLWDREKVLRPTRSSRCCRARFRRWSRFPIAIRARRPPSIASPTASDGGLHRVGDAAVLPELQSSAADQRWQAALLPVRHRGDRREGLLRSGPPMRRSPIRSASAAEMDRPRDQYTKFVPRRARCTQSGVSGGRSGRRTHPQALRLMKNDRN